MSVDQDRSWNSIREMNSGSLAYLGDAVYELYLRRRLLGDGRKASGRLHAEAIRYARASAQARAARQIYASGNLPQQAAEIMLRARNANPGSIAKHADPVEYRWATALEALVAYYYLNQSETELSALMEDIFTRIEETENEQI